RSNETAARCAFASSPPFTPFFGLAQDFVGDLVGLEGLGCLAVTGLDVRMHFLRLGTPCLLDRFEVSVALQSEDFEGAHLVGAARAVPRGGPAIVRGGGVARVLARLRAFARVGLGFLQTLEVVPLRVVLGRMAAAVVPSFAA